jgi:hypothetical protein
MKKKLTNKEEKEIVSTLENEIAFGVEECQLYKSLTKDFEFDKFYLKVEYVIDEKIPYKPAKPNWVADLAEPDDEGEYEITIIDMSAYTYDDDELSIQDKENVIKKLNNKL